MSSSSQQDRVLNIYQMLFQMASGDFTNRIALGDEKDLLTTFELCLNEFAAEFPMSIIKSGYISPLSFHQSFVQATFVLDQDGCICDVSENIPSFFNMEMAQLIAMPFSNFISKQSAELWAFNFNLCSEKVYYHNTLQILLINKEKNLIPAFCTISKVKYLNNIFINTISSELQNSNLRDSDFCQNFKSRPSDSELIQNIRDYIIQNLDIPLPPLKEIAKKFGSNEFKIKEGFRHFHNISLYQFYNEQRLSKAHSLILQTNYSLGDIAEMCGYTDYVNFYKAFKKRFQYAPSSLKRHI